jgi:hypothetical protein
VILHPRLGSCGSRTLITLYPQTISRTVCPPECCPNCLDCRDPLKIFTTIAKSQRRLAMDDNNQQYDDGDDRLAGDLLVGADAIRAYLVFLGMPDDTADDVYYFKR